MVDDERTKRPTVFSAGFYGPGEIATDSARRYRELLEHSFASSPHDERLRLLSNEAIEIIRHVTNSIREFVKTNRNVKHLVLDEGAIPLATWTRELDALADSSTAGIKRKLREMEMALQDGRVQGFTASMFIQGKPTFATLKPFYDVVFELIDELDRAQ